MPAEQAPSQRVTSRKITHSGNQPQAITSVLMGSNINAADSRGIDSLRLTNLAEPSSGFVNRRAMRGCCDRVAPHGTTRLKPVTRPSANLKTWMGFANRFDSSNLMQRIDADVAEDGDLLWKQAGGSRV